MNTYLDQPVVRPYAEVIVTARVLIVPHPQEDGVPGVRPHIQPQLCA